MQKWDYLFTRVDFNNEVSKSNIVDLGKQSWEIINLFPIENSTSEFFICLKRGLETGIDNKLQELEKKLEKHLDDFKIYKIEAQYKYGLEPPNFES